MRSGPIFNQPARATAGVVAGRLAASRLQGGAFICRDSVVRRIRAIALLALAMPQLVRYYTDWLWFGEVGFRQVFSTILRTQSLLFAAAFWRASSGSPSTSAIAVATMGDRRPTFVTREGSRCSCPAASRCSVWRWRR
jgi:uncharacterized membrane protein (UPF0182 family)